MNMLVILEIFHLFFIRNIHSTSLTIAAVRGTRAVWICLAITVAAQVVATYLPLANLVLDTRPVAVPDGMLMVALGAVFFAILEVEKQLRLMLKPRDRA